MIIGQETREVERKVIAILKVLGDSQQPLGGRVIARRLNDLGIDLGERAVRYHLKLMDERGLTSPVGRRDGRIITESGLEEIDNAMVGDRVGLVTTKIEMLAYRSSYDPVNHIGEVPINLSLFPKARFSQAIGVMKPVFRAGLFVSDLVAVIPEGETLGEVTVPPGTVGLATVSQIVVNGTLLKAGIPLDTRFGGILQIRDHEPRRFVDLIEYTGSSLDPSEVFITGKMTSVNEVASQSNGKILANFCEIPALARPRAIAVMERLETAGIKCLIKIGKASETVCEVPVEISKVGLILSDGLNPVAAAAEAGIEVVNHPMSGVIDFERLEHFSDCQSIGR